MVMADLNNNLGSRLIGINSKEYKNKNYLIKKGEINE